MPGVFAAGNLVHAAETADVAALGGRHAARHIARGAARRPSRTARGRAMPVTVAAPLPGSRPTPSGRAGWRRPPPRGRFLLRSDVFRRPARLEVRQGDRVLAAARTRLMPGRPAHLDAGWLARADPSAGPVLVVLR